MSTTTTGRRAEQLTAEYLESFGFEIVAQNWRNRFCEIDIVARYPTRRLLRRPKYTLYFIEVKYRHIASAGDGFAAITPRKQRQMTRAAEHWAHSSSFGGDMRLLVVAVSGDNFLIDGVIELS